MGVAQPNAVDGCLVTTRLFPSMELCEEKREIFLNYSILQPGHHVGGSRCIVIGTKT